MVIGIRSKLEPFRLPTGVDLNELKQAQTKIVKHLNTQGLSYEAIAEFFGIKSGTTLRTYIERKSKKIKSNNINIKILHHGIVNPNDKIERLISPTLRNEYLSLVSGQNSGEVMYKKRYNGQNRLSDENMLALSQICGDIFKFTESNSSNDRIRRICGRYFAYRTSADENTIVKSCLEVREIDPGGKTSDGFAKDTFFEFRHWHPDRFHEIEADEPRRTRGIVFYLNNNLFLLGSTEGGQAPCIFGIREPFGEHFKLLAGYTLTTNMDHVLFTARMVFVKNNSATQRDVGRIKIDPLDRSDFIEKEKFDFKLLENIPNKYLIETISSLRL